MGGETVCCLLCGAVFLNILLISFGIASSVIAVEYQYDDCQGEDSTGLSLSNWLFWWGIPKLILSFLSILTGIYTALKKKENWSSVALGIVAFSWLLYAIVWWIMGIVILCRSNRDCVAEGTDLGVMSIVAFAADWFILLAFACVAACISV